MAHPPFPETSSSHSCTPSLTKRCGMWKRNETHAIEEKDENRLTRDRLLFFLAYTFSLRLGECENMTLSALKPINHSLTSSRTKILDRSQLQLFATVALIDSSVPSSGPSRSCSVFSIAELQGLDKRMGMS